MLVCELTEASVNLFVSITVTYLGLSNFSETLLPKKLLPKLFILVAGLYSLFLVYPLLYWLDGLPSHLLTVTFLRRREKIVAKAPMPHLANLNLLSHSLGLASV